VSAHQIVQLKAEAAEGDAALMREKYNHSKVGGTGATHAYVPCNPARSCTAASFADAGEIVSCMLRGGSSMACEHTGTGKLMRAPGVLPVSLFLACLPACLLLKSRNNALAG
jgi:hypothetical protein